MVLPDTPSINTNNTGGLVLRAPLEVATFGGIWNLGIVMKDLRTPEAEKTGIVDYLDNSGFLNDRAAVLQHKGYAGPRDDTSDIFTAFDAAPDEVGTKQIAGLLCVSLYLGEDVAASTQPHNFQEALLAAGKTPQEVFDFSQDEVEIDPSEVYELYLPSLISLWGRDALLYVNLASTLLQGTKIGKAKDLHEKLTLANVRDDIGLSYYV